MDPADTRRLGCPLVGAPQPRPDCAQEPAAPRNLRESPKASRGANHQDTTERGHQTKAALAPRHKGASLSAGRASRAPSQRPFAPFGAPELSLLLAALVAVAATGLRATPPGHRSDADSRPLIAPATTLPHRPMAAIHGAVKEPAMDQVRQFFANQIPAFQQPANRRLAFDEISSADLPAEFRGDGPQQSRLAKLCQQTSSVLASVLPAPFGGHKRSILCQFFGQIPAAPSPGAMGPSLVGEPGAPTKARLAPASIESVAVLQQARQAPLTLLAADRHPIQLVLDHELQLHRQQNRQPPPPKQPAPRLPALNQAPGRARPLPVQDLKGADSVLSMAYQQRVEPPPGFVARHKPDPQPQSDALKSGLHEHRFSPPVTASSFRPVSAPLAWRIFNQSIEVPTTTLAPNQKPVSQAPAPSPTKASLIRHPSSSTVASTSSGSMLASTPSTTTTTATATSSSNSSTTTTTTSTTTTRKPEILLGRPPSSNSQSSSNETAKVTKRSEALPKVSAKPAPATEARPAEVRTIEVRAEQAPPNSSRPIEPAGQAIASSLSNTLIAASLAANATGSLFSAASGTRNNLRTTAHELKQVQNREELVIASINNLTRIAFGNQLRDTVKVINKLIDQQSGLFAASPKADAMLTSESRSTSNSSSTNRTVAKANVPSASGAQKQQPIVLKSAPSKAALLQIGAPSKPTKHPVRHKQIIAIAPTTQKTSKPSLTNNTKRQVATISSSQARPPSVATRSPVRQAGRATPTEAPPVQAQQQRRNSSIQDHDLISAASLVATDLKRHHAKSSTASSSSNYLADKTPWTPKHERLPHATATTAHQSTPMMATKRRLMTPSTQLPWSLPHNHANRALDFSPQSLPGSTSTIPPEASAHSRKPSTSSEALRRWIAKQTLVSSSKMPTLTTAPDELPPRPPQYSLNRLDNRVDELASSSPSLVSFSDSLTTLKMPTTPSKPIWTTVLTTVAAPSSTQSRWIPSPTTTLTTLPAPTQASSTSTQPPPTTTTVSVPELPSSTISTTIGVTNSLTDDVNEARASESISRYTTHLNEPVNELLATTRRQLQAQTLPQIAQTGDYFSAETISSWPERYQTMLEATRTTPSFTTFDQTTRRNGDVLEPVTSARSETEPTTIRRSSSEPTTSFLYGLPSNHKMTTTANIQLTNSSPLPTTMTTTSILTTKRQQLDSAASSRRYLPGPSVAYTLVGPQTSSDSEPQETVAETAFPQLPADPSPSGEPRPVGQSQRVTTGPEGNASTSSSLRPPYFELPAPQQPAYEQSPPFYDESPVRSPISSKRLYDLLIPSARHYFASPSTANVQPMRGFNLSALKYLAQNLLSPISPNETSIVEGNGTNTTPPVDPISAKNGTQITLSPAFTGAHSDRLFDLFGTSLPPDYYDLVLASEPMAAGDKTSGTNSSGKNLLWKAGNLLHDLRQLEQKRAAALMAAIRYQVPGPLVRPWDYISELQSSGGLASVSPFAAPRAHSLGGIHDRLDVELDPFGGQAHDDELLSDYRRFDNNHASQFRIAAQLVRGLKDALLSKQKLVPRDELEARLNPHRATPDNRRADERADHEPLASAASQSVSGGGGDWPSYLSSQDEPPLRAADHHNGSTNYTEARADFERQPPLSNLTRGLLDKLLGQVSRFPARRRFQTDAGLAQSNGSSAPDRDSDTLSFFAGDSTEADTSDKEGMRQRDADRPSHHHPRHMRLTTIEQDKPLEPIDDNYLRQPTKRPISIEDKSHDRANRTSEKHTSRKNPPNGQLNDFTETFECADRPAGFYPDSRSACQTFYHCSNTGHLLTFTCPQQTRFDEKSLKCGPWFEVPCSVSRINTKRSLA